MLPALEPTGAGAQGPYWTYGPVPWTVSFFLLISELVMVVSKLTSLLCSEYG